MPPQLPTEPQESALKSILGIVHTNAPDVWGFASRKKITPNKKHKKQTQQKPTAKIIKWEKVGKLRDFKHPILTEHI